MDPSYNNSFGSFGVNSGQSVMQQPVVSGENRKKRFWLVGVAALVILIIFAIIFVVILNNKTKINSSVKEKYLNYIVNGDVKNNNNVGTEYSNTRNYYVSDIIYSEENQTAYFDEAIKLLEATKPSESSEATEDVEMKISEQDAMLKMFKSYNILSNFGVDGIVGMYLSDGYSAVETNIISTINSFPKDMNQYTYSYVDSALNYANGIMKVVDISKNVGCNATSAEELAKCTILEDSESYNTQIEENIAAMNKITRGVDSAIPYFLNLAYAIGDVSK